MKNVANKLGGGQQTWIASANHTSAIATAMLLSYIQTNSKVRIFHLRLTALYVQYVQSKQRGSQEWKGPVTNIEQDFSAAATWTVLVALVSKVDT